MFKKRGHPGVRFAGRFAFDLCEDVFVMMISVEYTFVLVHTFMQVKNSHRIILVAC